MAKYSFSQNNFTGGQINRSMTARYNLDKYLTSVRWMENFIPELHGPATRRMGTYFLEDLGEPSVLIPFQFSSDYTQNFVLIFQENKIKIANYNGFVNVGDGDITCAWTDPEQRNTHWITSYNANLNTHYASISFDGELIQSWTGDIGVTSITTFVQDDIEYTRTDLELRYDTLGWNPETESFSDPGWTESFRVCSQPLGVSPLIIETDYKYSELYELSYTQAADVMYLAHINHPPRKLIRNSNSEWVLEDIQFVSQIDPPTSVTVAYNGSGTGTYTLRYKVVAYDADGRSSEATMGQLTNTLAPSQWPTGSTATVSWSDVEGAVSYSIYRESAGTYGYIGAVEDTEGTTVYSYVDINYSPDYTNTPREFTNPFEDGNYPAVVTFFQQRLVFGGPKNEPQKIYMSRTGLYEEFSKSEPLQADDMIEVQLASGRQDAVKWISSFGNLLVGTSGNEYRFAASSGTITASDISAREQSAWGSTGIPALIVGREILHVQRQGSYVRTLSYSLDADGYQGTDLSILASELFGYQHFIRQWIYRQYPDSSIMCVRSDGIVLCLVYHKEHSIYGWTQYTTKGNFKSVATISGEIQDDVYFVVEREINGEVKYYLEYMQPLWESEFTPIQQAHFVDCGLSYFSEGEDNQIQIVQGLEHLEGEEVVALVNGAPHGTRLVVNDGSVRLDYPANNVIVGLPYNSYLQLQNPEVENEIQSTLGRTRAYSGNTVVRLFDSVGGWYYYEKNPDRCYPIKNTTERWGTPIQPATDDYQINFNEKMTTMPSIWLMQIQPLPMSIAGIRLDVEIHD